MKYIYYDREVVARIDGDRLVVDEAAAARTNMPPNWVPNVRRLLLNALPEGARYDALVLKADRDGAHLSKSFQLLPYIDELPARFSVGDSPEPEAEDAIRRYAPLPEELPDGGVVSHLTAAWFHPASESRKAAKPSFSGVQDKFVAQLSVHGDRLVLSVPDPETERGNVLVKPASPDLPRIAENEFVCMELARSLGFDVPRVFLFEQPDMTPARKHFIVERFDVRVVDGAPDKLTITEFAPIMGLSAQEKYNTTTEELFREAGEVLPPTELAAFARAYFYGACIHNSDMHAKNFSLVTVPETGGYRLAPIYDQVCVGTIIPDAWRCPSAGRITPKATRSPRLSAATSPPRTC